VTHGTARYALYGFTLESELALPAAPEAEAGGEEPDVRVRFGPVAARDGERLWVDGEGALVFDVPDLGRYRIAGGRDIRIDPAPGASERNLRVYLLGSAMGALLQQRGLLPLHANAVSIAGCAFAFLGRSGAGKSTLAAWFADRGHPILCDDVCAIGFGGDGRPIVLPGVPRLRLREDALVHSGREAAGFERSFDGQDKYDVPTRAAAAAAPLPLGGCYLLAEAAPGVEGSIEPLGGVDAVEALVANTYRGRFLKAMGLAAPHLRQCLALAASVPVMRAARRWGRAEYESEAERLREHAASLFNE
jgi:hypothetical protein